jgi:hypothetical protein
MLFWVKTEFFITLLEVYTATGGIIYSAFNAFSKENPSLPSDEQSVAIATDILAKIVQLPAGLKGTVEGPGDVIDSVPVSLFVGFKREIDGKVFTGPGAKYQVRVGSGGQIRQIMINPVKYAPHEMVPLKPVDQAFQEMKAAKKYVTPVESKKAIIDKVTVDYWLESMTKGQDYIAPIYHFSGQCLDSSGKQLQDRLNGYGIAVN